MNQEKLFTRPNELDERIERKTARDLVFKWTDTFTMHVNYNLIIKVISD